MERGQQSIVSEKHDRLAAWADVRASVAIWASVLIAVAGGAFALSRVWDAQLLLHAAGWLVIGLLVVPIGFALALAVVGVVLTVLLALLSVPSWLGGRATGLQPLLHELWMLVGHVLPGYLTALRRVRRPGLWGGVAGLLVGVCVHGFVHGWS